MLVGPWAVFGLAGLEVANLLQRGSPWRGEALWTTDWLGIVLFVGGPMLAGLAAVDMSKSATGILQVASPSVASYRPALFVTAWTAGPAAVVHLITLLIALLVGGAFQPNGGWMNLALGAVVQLAAIVWYTAAGVMIGQLTRPVVAGLVAAVFALGAFYTASFGSGFQLLDLGGSTVSRLGLKYNTAYLLLQLVMLMTISAILVLFPIRSREDWREVWKRGVMLAVVVFGALSVSRSFGPETRFVPVQAEAPDTCYFTDPVVCVYSEHQRVAEGLVGAVVRLSEAAHDSGYSFLVPTFVHETNWSYRPPSADVAGVWTPTEVLAGGEWDDLLIVMNLVTPAHCPQIYATEPPLPQYLSAVEELAFTWLGLLEQVDSSLIQEVPDDVRTSRLTVEEALEKKLFLDSCGF